MLDRLGNWDIVYEIGLIVWIIFGLGYIFMIINVITDGLKKPARKAAKRLRKAEKVMVARILQEIVIMKARVKTLCLKFNNKTELEVRLFFLFLGR